MAKPKLAIVVGSVRPNRFADHPAAWIADIARSRGDFEVETVDLKDYPMPHFQEKGSPAGQPTQNETARKWQEKMAQFDAFIFTAAEYNHGPASVLKNALDYAYDAWVKKPVAFVGYGGVGGARSVEQLRLVCIELQMAPIRTAVHIQMPVYTAVTKEGKKLSDFDYLNKGASGMLDQLAWWTDALRTARQKG